MKKKENQVSEVIQDQNSAPEESKVKRVLNIVLNVVLVVAIVLAAITTYVAFVSDSGNGAPNILGLHVFSIQTDSMYPTLRSGDLIFGTAVKDPSKLQVGEIITYWTVINGERVLNTHRIHAIGDGGDYRYFQTKGDANNSVDTLTVHESKVVARYNGTRLEGVGKAFDYLQEPEGFLLVVVVPVFLFFLFHLVQFFRVLFEYQNVKNRIKYEQERGAAEDLLAEQQSAQEKARADLEAELREKLKAEIMASMAAQASPAQNPADPPKNDNIPEDAAQI